MHPSKIETFDMIYLLTAIGLPPGGNSTVQYSTHLHTNNKQNGTKQTIHRTTQKFEKSAGIAPSWRVLPYFCEITHTNTKYIYIYGAFLKSVAKIQVC